MGLRTTTIFPQYGPRRARSILHFRCVLLLCATRKGTNNGLIHVFAEYESLQDRPRHDARIPFGHTARSASYSMCFAIQDAELHGTQKPAASLRRI